eukprot:Skav201752  [mRNA]  locus=scaffold1973:85397:88605:+ [translate_table: standard]
MPTADEILARAAKRASMVAAVRDKIEPTIKPTAPNESSPGRTDSDASTVGAPTEDAKKMALQKFKEAQAEEAVTRKIQRRGARDMDSDLSSAPKLSRSVQSRELFERQPAKSTPVVATAVKAKAAPKVEVVSPQTSQAVAQCLQRATTADLQSPASQQSLQSPASQAQLQSQTSQASPSDHEDQGESSEDEEELQKRAAQVRARKDAHARYMRFSRSLTSKKTPIEIRRAGQAASGNSEQMQMLLEQWASCSGIWSESEFLIQIKKKSKHRSFGGRRWLTKGQLLKKYGSEEIVRQIVEAKEAPEAQESQTRAHPDLNGVITPDSCMHEETKQYLVWDKEGEKDTEDHVCNQLFEAMEGKDTEDDEDSKMKKTSKKNKSGKSSNKKKKGKKQSSSSSSSSESSSSSSEDSSSEDLDWHFLKHTSISFRVKEEKEDTKKNKKRKKKTGKDAKGKNANGKDGKDGKEGKEGKDGKPKEETEEQKQKREEKEAEAERKKQEKEKQATFKKEQRKGLLRTGMAGSKRPAPISG